MHNKNGMRPIVSRGEDGYDANMEYFTSNKIGGFARVVIVNPLHTKSPWLLFIVSCT